MNQTVVAIFGNRTVAQQAADALAEEGFPHSAMELSDEQPAATAPESAGTASAAPGGDAAPNVYCVLRMNAEDEASGERAASLLHAAGALDITKRQS